MKRILVSISRWGFQSTGSIIYPNTRFLDILLTITSLLKHTQNIFVPQFVIVLATRGLVAMRTQKEK